MRFWKDKGSWNDALVQGCTTLMIVLGAILGYTLWGKRGVILSLAGIPLGFVVGVSLVVLLCKFASDHEEPDTDDQN